mmetsp:Transcript_9082/g.17775  ORF Transcript_9082/g.17775 Transcript_9082/m.17775 type:complete len:201 (-) Transcript_9082:804-1406(-)
MCCCLSLWENQYRNPANTRHDRRSIQLTNMPRSSLLMPAILVSVEFLPCRSIGPRLPSVNCAINPSSWSPWEYSIIVGSIRRDRSMNIIAIYHSVSRYAWTPPSNGRSMTSVSQRSYNSGSPSSPVLCIMLRMRNSSASDGLALVYASSKFAFPTDLLMPLFRASNRRDVLSCCTRRDVLACCTRFKFETLFFNWRLRCL